MIRGIFGLYLLFVQVFWWRPSQFGRRKLGVREHVRLLALALDVQLLVRFLTAIDLVVHNDSIAVQALYLIEEQLGRRTLMNCLGVASIIHNDIQTLFLLHFFLKLVDPSCIVVVVFFVDSKLIYYLFHLLPLV